MIVDVSKRVKPDWLENVETCAFCGKSAVVDYNPKLPNVAVVKCGCCGSKAVFSPPTEFIVDGSFKVEL